VVLNGEALRAIRKARGLTQSALADHAHISKQYLCDIEAGRRKGSEAIAAALAPALLVAPAALLTAEVSAA
jgi:transcriptional regulator with XRE-family HTH domain